MRPTAIPLHSLPIALCCAIAPAQDPDPRVAFLREHAVAVRTVDPADDDFADLEPLKALIGDARIVGLGEQTHGDGAAFHGKTRLVEFLHREMGFDVLVWESGMFDCLQVEKALREGESIHEAWRQGIFGVWAASEQVRPLFDYVDATRKTDRPLEIAGMDSQITSAETPEVLADYVGELAKEAGDRTPAGLSDAFELLVPRIENLGWTMPALSDEDRKACRAAVGTILSALDAGGKAGPLADMRETERSFATRTLRNLDAMIEMLYWGLKSRGEDKEPDDMRKYANAREPAMSDTLVWLAEERYPDRKLIVWAASSHLVYDHEAMEWPDGSGGWKPDATGWEPMGVRAHAALGEAMYVVDFTAYEGKIGSVAGWSRDLEPAAEGSFEALCHATGHAHLFVDLRTLPRTEGGAWLREPMVARPRGYLGMRADWGAVCDALFCSDEMYPSTPVREGRGR